MSNEHLKETMASKKLPTEKVTLNTSKRNIALVLDASFNPPTIGHFGMLEATKSAILSAHSDEIHVAGGFLSAANDKYGKAHLLPAYHRVNMLRRAVANSDWLEADVWDAAQPEW